MAEAEEGLRKGHLGEEGEAEPKRWKHRMPQTGLQQEDLGLDLKQDFSSCGRAWQARHETRQR